LIITFIEDGKAKKHIYKQIAEMKEVSSIKAKLGLKYFGKFHQMISPKKVTKLFQII
jgi:hypothetical protein